MMNDRCLRFVEKDPYLKPYEKTIQARIQKIHATEKRFVYEYGSLAAFASGHSFYGLHTHPDGWVFREWAPNAGAVYLIGDMTGWETHEEFMLQPAGPNGVWETRLPPAGLKHGDLYRLRIDWPGGSGDRIPAYAHRVVQDPDTLIFNAQVWRPKSPYPWQNDGRQTVSPALLIYEAHVGMALEEAKIGTYREFTDFVLPRVVEAGYNTLQLMAIQEHPYYASFGYQVANFFAASSRFGPPEDLKRLIDAAHGQGLCVLIDLVHSHAAPNEVEGLSRFDGTLFQYFHDGPRGVHSAWGSRCFDYSKVEVLQFLLSNCRFWLDEYHLDGFRFDGVTSMLYRHHGLEKAFESYDDYFNDSVDDDALVYLTLANRLIHDIKPEAVTIAEDVSGMPGLAVADSEGGIGFDYRFAMGIPDLWIRLIKSVPDEAWPTGGLWHELLNRRSDEKTISYAESHDQALVGDQALIFRLIGPAMYHHMRVADEHVAVDRGMALHKMIRLVTMATAGGGYLNFMGNEFGHPEWIDFPREGNDWSYHYARRQWCLVDDPDLKYHQLAAFDRELIVLAKTHVFTSPTGPELIMEHFTDKVMAFARGEMIFAFNFHPTQSYTHYRFEARPGKYRMLLDSDATAFGGHGRLVPDQVHFTLAGTEDTSRSCLSLYLPSRTAIVLKKDAAV